MPIIGQYDGILMGDDEYTYKVIERGAKAKLKVLSKYGTGLDKVDLDAAKKFGIEVRNVTGINHTTVAEHVFALLLSYAKNIPMILERTRQKQWLRPTGFDLKGKKLGIIGLGRIGKQVSRIADVFNMNVMAWDSNLDTKYCIENNIATTASLEKIFQNADIITIHLPLSHETKGLINKDLLTCAQEEIILINTARGGIINQKDLKERLLAYTKNYLLN